LDPEQGFTISVAAVPKKNPSTASHALTGGEEKDDDEGHEHAR